MKMKIDLENYETWYGTLDVVKLDKNLKRFARVNNVNCNNLSTKDMAYMFLEKEAYRKVLLDIFGTARQEIVLKGCHIINTYNDTVYYYINIKDKIIKRLCKTKKMLDSYVMKIYPEFRLD